MGPGSRTGRRHQSRHRQGVRREAHVIAVLAAVACINCAHTAQLKATADFAKSSQTIAAQLANVPGTVTGREQDIQDALSVRVLVR